MNNQTVDLHFEQLRRTETNSLRDYWLYLRSFVKRGLNVASIAPSSQWTASAILRGIDFNQADTILELGAGTGAVTASLLHASKEKCRTIIVERDPVFCERLVEKFPEAEIVSGDAFQLEDILERSGSDRVDHILSTLPINWLPAEQRTRFLRSVCRSLSPAGSFRQLTHLPWIPPAMYRQHFASVRCSTVWLNFPPAGCYICSRPIQSTPQSSAS